MVAVNRDDHSCFSPPTDYKSGRTFEGTGAGPFHEHADTEPEIAAVGPRLLLPLPNLPQSTER